MDWQPIATAPKDGTLIGVWNQREPNIIRYARWSDGPVAKYGKDWVTVRGFALSNVPTHWIPLPAPPSDQPADPDACRQRGHGRVVCADCGSAYVGVETVRAKGDDDGR